MQELPIENALTAIARWDEARRREILVAISNPDTVAALISLAANLSRPDERIVALKVVTVVGGTPLATAQSHANVSRRFRDILQVATKRGAEAGVRVETVLQAAHVAAQGIVEVAASRPATRLLLLGWHGPLARGHLGASVCRDVIRTAPCDVAIFLDRGLGSAVGRILVPAAGGPHARLGLRLACDLAGGEASRLDVLRVARPGRATDVAAHKRAVEKLIRDELGDEPRGTVTARVVQSPSVLSGILDASSDGYDLMIVGASEEGALHNWLFGSIPDTLAERAPCSVLLVHKREPASVSRIRRAVKRLLRPSKPALANRHGRCRRRRCS